MIVVAFMLAFFSLAQDVRVVGHQLRHRPPAGRARAAGRAGPGPASDLSRLGREPAIRKLALDAGLGQLGEPLVLPAR